MERWVTLVLAMLVIVIAFVVVNKIKDGINNSTDPVDSYECRIQGGNCVSDCNGEVINVACADGLTCCKT